MRNGVPAIASVERGHERIRAHFAEGAVEDKMDVVVHGEVVDKIYHRPEGCDAAVWTVAATPSVGLRLAMLNALKTHGLLRITFGIKPSVAEAPVLLFFYIMGRRNE
jgi:hypothetical protein